MVVFGSASKKYFCRKKIDSQLNRKDQKPLFQFSTLNLDFVFYFSGFQMGENKESIYNCLKRDREMVGFIVVLIKQLTTFSQQIIYSTSFTTHSS